MEEVDENEEALDGQTEEEENDIDVLEEEPSDPEEEIDIEERLQELDYLAVSRTNDYMELVCQSTVKTVEEHQYCKQLELYDLTFVFLNLILGLLIGFFGIKGFFENWR